jgi:F-box-like
MEWSPDSPIIHIPDEVLLEIFDSYRRIINSYDHQWRKKHAWITLTHVCRKWRATMFASASRLDLAITVGPEKPGDIETILSGPLQLPILIDYMWLYEDISDSALWRLGAALRHHDRVREIAFEGGTTNFDKLFKATNCPFPVLESLVFRFRYSDEAEIPDTFLSGPDQSVLRLRRLNLYGVSLTSISRFLLSATSLTNLALSIDTAFSPSRATSLLACLQGMPFLGHLELDILSRPLDSLSRPTPKHIVPLSQLTYFLYIGSSIFLDALVAGLSAPSLRDVNINYDLATVWPPFAHLSRFISEIERRYHAVHAAFQGSGFHLSLLTQSECIPPYDPRFRLDSVSNCSPELIMQMSGELSAMFTTVEELRVTFDKIAVHVWVDSIPWRRFLQQFPNLKALRTEGIEGANTYGFARSLLQDHEESGDDLAFLPTLEEIEFGNNPLSTDRRQRGSELAAFQRFVSVRQQAGRPVKLSFGR